MGFFSNITGGSNSSQNRYITASNAERTAYREAANSTLAPFAVPGIASQTTIGNLTGVYGAPAQQASFGAYEASPLVQKLGLGGSYTASPGYKWQLGQGLNAIDSSAAAKGLLGSGATLKAEQEYGQGLAAQDYGNWQDRVARTYGDYLGTLGGTANTGANAVGTQSNNILTAGNINAGGTAQIGANKTAGANGLAGLIAGGISKLPAMSFGGGGTTTGTGYLY